MAFQPALVGCGSLQRDNSHRQVGQIAGQVIPEERVVGEIEKPNHGSNATLSAVCAVFDGSSAGSAPVCSTFCKRPFPSSLIFVPAWISASSFPRRSAFSRAVK